MNLYRCRLFYKFYENYFDKQTVQLRKIIVEKKDYQMKVVGRETKVQSRPKLTNVVYFETDDFLLLFFSKQYLGLFQQVLKPFIFLKIKKTFNIKYKNIYIIQDFETVETEQNRIIVFPNRYDIKKVIIPLQNTP
jgi:hypothetical protein